MTLGIVGVGNVGSKVETVARKLGLKVLLNDLPRQEKEGETAFSCLQQLAEECDVIRSILLYIMKVHTKHITWQVPTSFNH